MGKKRNKQPGNVINNLVIQITTCRYLPTLTRWCEWGLPTSNKGLENITDYRQNEEKITN